MDKVAINHECFARCPITEKISPYPRVCKHGRLWKHFARIGNEFYWHRISRWNHPITYYRARRTR